MDKIEILFDVKANLEAISEKMLLLNDEVNIVASCIAGGIIIENNIVANVINGLQEISDISLYCRKLYSEIYSEDAFLGKIKDLQAEISANIDELELERKLSKYSCFFNLQTDDEETKILLDEHKENLKNMINNYSPDMETNLNLYCKFTDAIKEKDSAKLLEYAGELSQIFGYKLIGKAVIDKTIYISEEKNKQITMEKISEEKEQRAKEKRGLEEKIHDDFTYLQDVNNDIKYVDAKQEQIYDEVVDENRSEKIIEDELNKYGLIVENTGITVDIVVDKGKGELKKLNGAKDCRSDISDKYKLDNILFMNNIYDYYFINAEVICALHNNVSLENIKLSINYLKSKGYIREYNIDNLETFYAISPKGEKAFSYNDVCNFLKIKKRHSTITITDDHSDITLCNYITYFKALSKYTKFFDDTISVGLNNEGFRIVLENKNGKKHLIMGAFFSNEKDAVDYIGYCKKNNEEYDSVIIVGYDNAYAKSAIEYFSKQFGFNIEKIYYSSFCDDAIISYISGEKVELNNIIGIENVEKNSNEMIDQLNQNDEDEEKETSDKIESKITDVKENMVQINKTVTDEFVSDNEKAEISKVDEIKEDIVQALCDQNIETILNNKNAYDTDSADLQVTFNVSSDIRQQSGNKNIIPKFDYCNVMTEVFRMIAEDKTYCAVMYLCSMAEYDKNIKLMYEKVAYAVNDPKMQCLYDSQNIFSIYSDTEDIFSKYLMLSAGLRCVFMNHNEYDYSIDSLQSTISEISVVSIPELTEAIYTLVNFKKNYNKGIDFYADYRETEQIDISNRMTLLIQQAKSHYDNDINGKIKENVNNPRVIETLRAIFNKSGDLALYLEIIISNEQDAESLSMIKKFLEDNFIKDKSPVETTNIDMNKIDRFIDIYWDKAAEKVRAVLKTSHPISFVKNNMVNKIKKIVVVLCEWVILMEKSGAKENDAGKIEYLKIKKSLCYNFSETLNRLDSITSDISSNEYAGLLILKNTILELLSRLNGNYKDTLYKYYYIDFLKGNNVMLDSNYFPDMTGAFIDFDELYLPNRILQHSKEDHLIDFEKKLEDIFYGEDDYGVSRLIFDYIEDVNNESFEHDYKISESEQQAKDEAQKKLNDFIENLELAQSYGQIEETKENKKELIQRNVYTWFEYANRSKNFGFFKRILEKYKVHIQNDAKTRGNALLKELEYFNIRASTDDNMKKRISKIRQMIDVQNYTVAEDLLSRINANEFDYEDGTEGSDDYLKRFMIDYEANYMMVNKGDRKLSELIKSSIHNKDDKGGKRLVDNWMSNGQPLGKNKLIALLEALGFISAEVEEKTKINNKIENYSITIKKIIGRKVNYKHPISAFGSKSNDEGFRVICLFGKYDADRLIEEFKNVSDTKNTLVLLDYALQISDRRLLAYKIKSEFNNKVFAVIDRVVVKFLATNYNVQFVNKMLMEIIMPFAYYQPYVWDSAKIMPPEMFMGRKEYLEKIESADGVNIVYGGRQLGKSALLKMAKMNIDKNENNDRAVLIEIKGLDFKNAANKIGHELYDEGILKKDIDTTDWNELARVIKNRLSDTSSEHIPYLLLLLDEADAFIESCQSVNFQPLDALKEIQNIGIGRFKFVIAGLHNIIRFKRESLNNNSVLTHLSHITVKPFNQTEARQLLEKPLYCLGFRFPEDKQSLVSLILANTNYFPGLIQLYCAKLIEAMRSKDYAGYDKGCTPAYEIIETHIRKVLADPEFNEQVREKFEITLKLGDDDMYYIIALMIAYLYHQNTNSAAQTEGYSAKNVIEAAEEYGIKKIADQSIDIVNGFMQELVELNILRQTHNGLYLFSRYSFFQMMGSATEIDDKICECMEE